MKRRRKGDSAPTTNPTMRALAGACSKEEKAEILAADRTDWTCPFCCRWNESVRLPCSCGAEIQLGTVC